MNMNYYGIEPDPVEAEYGDEVMCAGWNPAILQICEQQSPAATNKQNTASFDLMAAGEELFLQRMYVNQR